MKKESLLKTLEELGLSENESKIYLATLSQGSATVMNIAKASGVKRTTIYTVIEALKAKGLMKVEVIGFKKRYLAESPEMLEKMIDFRKETFKSQLPEFLSLYKTGENESLVKYYEGIEAVKAVYEENIRDINPGESYLVISNADKIYDMYGDWFEKFLMRRARLPIDIRMIFEDNASARKHKEFERNFNHTIRFLPKETNLTTNLVITPQRILIHQLEEPIIGIVIENKGAISMHQQLFEVLWSTSKE